MGTRRGIAAALGALCLAFVFAACGGDGEGGPAATTTGARPPRTLPEPVLPVEVGAELAAASDEVAVLLEANDPCAAEVEARELRRRVAQAAEDGRVPAELQEPLLAAVRRLQSQIACEPQAEEEDENDDDEGPGRGKKKGRDKGGNGGEGGDD
jgi:hypothetical protein